MALYHTILTDHYRNPHNRGFLESPDFDSGKHNPSCGDIIRIQGILRENTVKVAYFDGKGCILSQAAASILTEYVQGKPIKRLLSIDKNEFLSMLKIELGPTRQTCVLLALNALQDGLRVMKSIKRERKNAQSGESSTKTPENT